MDSLISTSSVSDYEGAENRHQEKPLLESFKQIRCKTRELCAPLSVEDCNVQSMPDASPSKWHLAHTTWFFEKMILEPNLPGYRAFDPQFNFLFNSYYES